MPIDTAFTHFPSLITGRLRLRQIQTGDGEALFALKSNPKVTSPYGVEPHRSLDDTLRWITRIQADYERREGLLWIITLKDDDRAIGEVTFWNIDPGFHCAEIGYELNPLYWKQGIMSEALPAIIGYGFQELGLHRIEACPLAGNEPSLVLLRKLGFQVEGSLRQRIYFRGRFEDQLYFGLLRDEWKHPGQGSGLRQDQNRIP